MNYLIFILVALIPVVFWVWVFLNESKEPRDLSVMTFLLACFSVVPLLAYKQVFSDTDLWYEQVVAGLGIPGLRELGLFVLLFGMMSIFVFSVAAVIAVFWTLFSRSTLLNTLRSVVQEMGNFSLLGIVVAGIVLASDFLTEEVVAVVAGIIFLAASEEYAKHLLVRFIDDDKFRSINDALVFSVLAGLGFAFMENAFVYFPAYWGSEGFISVILLRSVLLVFAHAMFSGIFGYFYGVGHFAQPLLVERMVAEPQYFFKRRLHKLLHLKSEPSFREEKMMEGLIVATVLHAVFNVLMQFSEVGLAFMVVAAGGGWLFWLLAKKENHKKLGLVGTRWVPNQMEFMEVLNKVREAKEKEGLNPDNDEDRVQPVE